MGSYQLVCPRYCVYCTLPARQHCGGRGQHATCSGRVSAPAGNCLSCRARAIAICIIAFGQPAQDQSRSHNHNALLRPPCPAPMTAAAARLATAVACSTCLACFPPRVLRRAANYQLLHYVPPTKIHRARSTSDVVGCSPSPGIPPVKPLVRETFLAGADAK